MTDNETRSKLSFLRQDAADALRIYLALAHNNRWRSEPNAEQVNVAALDYVNAHTKYTLACLEAREGDILPYVEIPRERK